MQIIQPVHAPARGRRRPRGRLSAHEGLRRRASSPSATTTSSRRSSAPSPQAADDPVPADPAPRDPRGDRPPRRAPARLPDRRGQRALAETLAADGHRVPDLRHAARDPGGAGRGQPALPALQRGRLHRRPRLGPRRDRRRRLHADGRGRVPAQADARRARSADSSSRCSTRATSSAGFGRYAESLDDPAVVHRFLEAIPACEERLADYRQEGNERLFAVVDELISQA